MGRLAVLEGLAQRGPFPEQQGGGRRSAGLGGGKEARSGPERADSAPARSACPPPAPSSNHRLPGTGTSQGQGPSMPVQPAPADRPVLRSSTGLTLWSRARGACPAIARGGAVSLPHSPPPYCGGRGDGDRHRGPTAPPGVTSWGLPGVAAGPERASPEMSVLPWVWTAPRLSHISLWFLEVPKAPPFHAVAPLLADSPLLTAPRTLLLAAEDSGPGRPSAEAWECEGGAPEAFPPASGHLAPAPGTRTGCLPSLFRELLLSSVLSHYPPPLPALLS